MIRKMMLRSAVAALLVGTGVAAATPPASAPNLKVLSELKAGQWEFARDRSDKRMHSLCLPDRTALIEMGGGDGDCSFRVIKDTMRKATVEYRCTNGAHGRTDISTVTDRSARIQSQGVRDGLPFNHIYRGRRTGECQAH